MRSARAPSVPFSMRGRAVPAALLAFGLLWSPRAWSDTLRHEGLELEWHAPPDCPQGGVVLHRIRELLAGSEHVHELISARGTVESTSNGTWKLTLETRQGAQDWKRSVPATSCEELADAGALIVALAIDPNLKPAPQPDLRVPEDTGPPPSANRGEGMQPVVSAPPSTPTRRGSRRTPQRRSEVNGSLAAAAIGDWGSLPRAAVGAEIAIAVHLPPMRLELLGVGLPRVREVVAEDPERGGKVELWGAALRTCYVVERGDLQVGPCAGVEGGVIRARGFGATDWNSSETSRWVAPYGGAMASHRLLGRASLRAAVQALLPLVQPEFVIEGVGRVHRPSPIVGRLELGLEVAFR